MALQCFEWYLISEHLFTVNVSTCLAPKTTITTDIANELYVLCTYRSTQKLQTLEFERLLQVNQMTLSKNNFTII